MSETDLPSMNVALQPVTADSLLMHPTDKEKECLLSTRDDFPIALMACDPRVATKTLNVTFDKVSVEAAATFKKGFQTKKDDSLVTVVLLEVNHRKMKIEDIPPISLRVTDKEITTQTTAPLDQWEEEDLNKEDLEVLEDLKVKEDSMVLEDSTVRVDLTVRVDSTVTLNQAIQIIEMLLFHKI